MAPDQAQKYFEDEGLTGKKCTDSNDGMSCHSTLFAQACPRSCGLCQGKTKI